VRLHVRRGQGGKVTANTSGRLGNGPFLNREDCLADINRQQAIIDAYLPGSNFIDKGIFFGVLAWLAMGLGFFPLIGDGVFSIGMGLGVKPAMLMFGMLLIYSLTTTSFVYDKLNAFK
jgi:hypothetical protein